ncbi:MAG TPA: TIR domain-containing protein [Allosphingosinicella sp.]|nr:TIR domain-containing protein [Allosphingosinicella sp.]
MSGHVFISYASENGDEANEIVALIESKGMTAWIAPRDVRPGFDYSEELQRALETCAAFVVLVTPDANTSPYVRAETEMAFSSQKPMLPVRLGEIAPAPGLAFFLKIRHWTDAYGARREAALARLVLELQTLTGKAPSWAPKAGGAAPPPLAEAPAPPAPPPPSPPPPAPAAPPPLAAGNPAPVPAPAAKPRGPLLFGLIAGGAAVIVIALVLIFGARQQQPPGPLPGPDVNNPQPAPEPNPPPAQPRGYADELTDFGVAPKAELETNVGTPTPLAINVGGRVTTEDLQRLAQDNRTILVDVLAQPHPQTIAGALYMPDGGMPGTFEDIHQVRFSLQLLQATAGDTSRPLVFFCQGASCWESYNAMLRANAAGYGQIYWYRGGLAAWQEAGLAMAPLPEPFNMSAPTTTPAD